MGWSFARERVSDALRNPLRLGAAAAAGTALFVLTTVSLAADEELPTVHIGIVYDGPVRDGSTEHWVGELMQRIEEETLALTRREFEVRFPDDKRLSGEWSLERIRASVDRLLADPEIELVLAVGVLSSTDAGRRRELPKPLIASSAIEPGAQGLPLVKDTTGVRNLNYSVSPGSSVRDLTTLIELAGPSRIHILVDSLVLEAVPGLQAYSDSQGQRLGVQLVLVPAASSAAEALERLPADAEAVYVTPLVRMGGPELDRLVSGLIERRLASFSLLGRSEVERGILAARRPSTDLPRRARRIALNIQRVLLGEDAGTLPVTLDETEKLVINMATARAIGLPIRWRLLTGADLLNEELEPGRTLSLAQAVEEAVRANLTLRAKDREVAAGAESVRRAVALLKPQVDALALGSRIDEDRAEASLGSRAERTVSGSVSVSQILYSDAASANARISRRLQDSLEGDRERLRLDVALAAASAFLNVLRAETLKRVQQENLALTESNLELARRRERIGYSGAADVFRWESELANGRSAVIAATNQVRAARAALNRILNRPEEEPFEPVPPALGDPVLLTGHGRLAPYLDTRQGVDLFREFLVREGLSNAPELRALESSIAAQERALLSARRSFWSPDLVFTGEVGRDISKGGAGSEGPPPALPFEQAGRDSWSVALTAALPLYAGGERAARARQASEELSGLRLQRDALAEGVELRIRTAMFAASSTFPAIDLARESAEAARKNLELVTDAYSQGVVSVIDLLDAQNAALVAELNAANAVYDFLLDLMELQRAANILGFFMTEEEREAWFERLETFFAEAGGAAGPSSR